MRLYILSVIFLIISTSPAGFPQPKTSQPSYLDLYLEDSVKNQEFFTDALAEIDVKLIETKAVYPWLPVDETNPLKVVICTSNEYCLQFINEDTTLWFLFTNNDEWPISGNNDQVTIRIRPTWHEWPDSLKRLYLAGEVFRVVQIRLKVNPNPNPEDENQTSDIAQWLYYGSPITWAASVFPKDGQEVIAHSRTLFFDLGVEPAKLDYHISQEHFEATYYVANELLIQTERDPMAYFEYYKLIGESVAPTTAFVEVFGINQTEFENNFDNE